jgi:hypothetical protein
MKTLIRPVALVTILSVLGQTLVSADTFTKPIQPNQPLQRGPTQPTHSTQPT